MKQKMLHFFIGLLIYGTIGYFIMYFTEPDQNPWFYTVFWGITMALVDVIVFRKFKIQKIKNEHKKRSTRSRFLD